MSRSSREDLPVVSVIVPVYNAERFLPACIASILDQSYEALQLILVDDGSTDGSGRICDDAAAADERVVVIHQPNSGIGAAQNAGLAAARGSLVTFCDNDDLMSPQLIKRLVDILQASDADMSCCRWRRVGESAARAELEAEAIESLGKVSVFSDAAAAYQSVFSLALRRLRRSELRYFSEANWAKLYRAELFAGIRFPEGGYAQDVWVAMDLYLRMRRVASCADPLYYWVQHSGSVSHSSRNAAYYHDIVSAHARSFELAAAHGITPARAYFGLTALRRERRSVASAQDQQVYKSDRALVAGLRRSLPVRKRVSCVLLTWLRQAEVIVYDRTVHRRR